MVVPSFREKDQNNMSPSDHISQHDELWLLNFLKHTATFDWHSRLPLTILEQTDNSHVMLITIGKGAMKEDLESHRSEIIWTQSHVNQSAVITLLVVESGITL